MIRAAVQNILAPLLQDYQASFLNYLENVVRAPDPRLPQQFLGLSDIIPAGCRSNAAEFDQRNDVAHGGNVKIDVRLLSQYMSCTLLVRISGRMRLIDTIFDETIREQAQDLPILQHNEFSEVRGSEPLALAPKYGANGVRKPLASDDFKSPLATPSHPNTRAPMIDTTAKTPVPTMATAHEAPKALDLHRMIWRACGIPSDVPGGAEILPAPIASARRPQHFTPTVCSHTTLR
ncbi:hypothetical protein FQN54_000339 [Arachnomyces sp. PD_36]|nr:hypothetical protein FQN54_000339 [Arachnomyces sp. PD_36]